MFLCIEAMKSFDWINSLLGVVEALKVITAEKSRRIAKFAFDYATKHGRKKVSIFCNFQVDN